MATAVYYSTDTDTGPARAQQLGLGYVEIPPVTADSPAIIITGGVPQTTTVIEDDGTPTNASVEAVIVPLVEAEQAVQDDDPVTVAAASVAALAAQAPQLTQDGTDDLATLDAGIDGLPPDAAAILTRLINGALVTAQGTLDLATATQVLPS